MSNYKSQYGQDKWVVKTLKGLRNGFFVECGAYTGFALSNTYALEKDFGWTGICVEPNDRIFKILQEKRECITDNSCVGADRSTCQFAEVGTLGGIVSSYAAKHKQRIEKAQGKAWKQAIVTKGVVPLSDVLKRHSAPRLLDYLSLDVEGGELPIVETFPWGTYTFKLMTIEHNNYDGVLTKMIAILKPHGYRLVKNTHGDGYFVHRSLRN